MLKFLKLLNQPFPERKAQTCIEISSDGHFLMDDYQDTIGMYRSQPDQATIRGRQIHEEMQAQVEQLRSLGPDAVHTILESGRRREIIMGGDMLDNHIGSHAHAWLSDYSRSDGPVMDSEEI